MAARWGLGVQFPMWRILEDMPGVLEPGSSGQTGGQATRVETLKITVGWGEDPRPRDLTGIGLRKNGKWRQHELAASLYTAIESKGPSQCWPIEIECKP